MTRTIQLNLSVQDQVDIVNDTGVPEFSRAFHYLSTWGMTDEPESRITTARIYRDGTGADLIAVYADAQGEAVYSIGAVWREMSGYSFHS